MPLTSTTNGCRAPSEPQRGQSRDDAQDHVGSGDKPIAAPDEEHRFQTEGGEGGEAAEDAGEKEEPRIRGKVIELLGEPRQDSRGEAPEDVHREGARGKAPVDGVMQHPAGKLEARHRPQRSSQRHEKNSLHVFLVAGRRGRCFADTERITMRPLPVAGSGVLLDLMAVRSSAATSGSSNCSTLSRRRKRPRLPLPCRSRSGSSSFAPWMK